MKKKPKVSFDFDSTLSEKEVQELAKLLIENDIDVWITTTRYEDIRNYKAISGANHDDLIKVITELNIPFHKVKFTNFEWKYEYLKDSEFIWHLDDNPDEFRYIQKFTNVEPIIYGRKKWRKLCLKVLKIK